MISAVMPVANVLTSQWVPVPIKAGQGDVFHTKPSAASQSSQLIPLTASLLFLLCSLAKNLNASMVAAMQSRVMDTASNAGALSALESDFGSAPHDVPGVPAPNALTPVFAARAAEVLACEGWVDMVGDDAVTACKE